MHSRRSSHQPPDIKVDPHTYTTDDANTPPQSPFNRSTSRRHLVILAIFAFLVFCTFSSTNWIIPYTPWKSTGVFVCPSAPLKPHTIVPPPPRDNAPISKSWDNLRGLFDSHPPKPNNLVPPKHDQFPFKDGLKDMLNLSSHEAHASRTEHMSVVRHLPPYPENHFAGKGVIMLAGGKYSEFAATSLGMLRAVGSTLPVEVWMKDKSEELDGWCAEMVRDGMSCRRLQDHMDVSVLPNPYQWKVFVMLFSSFEEFIFLDADDMPIRNPDVVFDSEVYHEHGAILWPDYWKHTGSPWLPYVIGLSDDQSNMLEGTKTAESGQVVWNKRWHWKSLCLATYYNYYGPKYYFSLQNQGWAGWGDKDTFPTAMKALDESFFQVSRNIITVFVEGSVLGIGMVQADPANETHTIPMFLHSNIVKWSMREFLCVGCPAVNSHVNYHTHLENKDSPINKHLLEGKRIFATSQLAEYGMDPEPLIWKVMEDTACRSVWGTSQACKQTREHMSRTFGFKFTSSRFASLFGYNNVCVVDP